MTPHDPPRIADVSRETSDRLRCYVDLLLKWNPAINLVSRTTIDDVWIRHIRDSLQLLPLAAPGPRWVDLGSGGGFPGMVIAIAAGQWRPELRITLVEADQRKTAFLAEVARQTATDVSIRNARSEDLEPLGADTLSARAFAPLDRLMPHILRHMKPDGIALLPKGRRHVEEVAEARKSWNFTCDTVPSETDSDAVILKIQGVTRV